MTRIAISTGVYVDMNLLEGFLLVAEYGSFRRAADRLHRSNSTMSTQVRQLEEQLDVKLFERTTRSLQLTDEGAALYDDAKGAVSQVRLALQRASRHGARPGGRSVHIACTIALSWRVLPPMLAQFSQRYKNIPVEVEEMRSGEMTRPILSGDLAFGIGQVSYTDPDIEYEPLREEPMVALIPKSFPQSRLSSITLEEFAALPLLVQPASSPSRKTVEKALHEAGLTPRIKLSGVRFHTLLAMVSAGQGVGAFSRLSTSTETERGFRQVPFSNNPIRLTIGLLKLPGRTFTAPETALLEAARQELGR